MCVFNKIFSYIKFSHSGAAGKFIQPSLQPGTFAAWGVWRRTSWPARRSRARQAQSRGQAVLSRRKPRHIPTQCRRYSNAQTLAAEAAHQDPGSPRLLVCGKPRLPRNQAIVVSQSCIQFPGDLWTGLFCRARTQDPSHKNCAVHDWWIQYHKVYCNYPSRNGMATAGMGRR